jgi:1,4-dihydroxy-2-naphthoate octaprenyltransferase
MNIWIAGARPRTLPAAIAPVLVATALAGSNSQVIPALLALTVSLALQIGVNYANDYSDGIRGTDNDRVGPLRITASGLAAPRSVRNAAVISFGVAAIALHETTKKGKEGKPEEEQMNLQPPLLVSAHSQYW